MATPFGAWDSHTTHVGEIPGLAKRQRLRKDQITEVPQQRHRNGNAHEESKRKVIQLYAPARLRGFPPDVKRLDHRKGTMRRNSARVKALGSAPAAGSGAARTALAADNPPKQERGNHGQATPLLVQPSHLPISLAQFSFKSHRPPFHTVGQLLDRRRGGQGQ